ncbi:hypothetical protein [Sulfitobacter sp. TBRI5]|uniref:hypothetical protein n=1 Tax=Sulfitobacter sp. TBRI5 TaxID=2989732 RepID=UPI003D9B4D5B
MEHGKGVVPGIGSSRDSLRPQNECGKPAVDLTGLGENMPSRQPMARNHARATL